MFPGRDAARSSCEALLRRTGTVTNTVLGTAPALRSGMKNAAPRPGHNVAKSLRPLPHYRVEAPRATARAGEIQAGEAEQDRCVAAVQQRDEHRRAEPRLEHMSHEVGERHLARQNE